MLTAQASGVRCVLGVLSAKPVNGDRPCTSTYNLAREGSPSDSPRGPARSAS